MAPEPPSQERTLWGFNVPFWILVIGSFINSTGSALVFPFIALYIGRRFHATEVEIGLIFTYYAAVSLFSGAAGGALSDRFGRKTVMVIGLGAAIVFSLSLAFAQTVPLILVAILITGLFSPIFGPAANAMVADMLPEERLASGYGLVRVAQNLGVVIGPLLGGLLADTDNGFVWLFLGDAATSGIFALVIAFLLPETRPAAPPDAAQPTSAGHWWDALKLFDGYGKVIRDVPFFLFSLTFLGATLVYSQMNTNLVLYMDKEFGMSAGQYSLLIALNAAMVVLFQFPITAYIERFKYTAVLAFGALCYGIGFGMFGFLGRLWWFALGMAIITVGEMVMIPVAQAVVAEMAPEDMRGRYMGFYGLVWGLSFGIGPLAGGVILAAGDGLYRRYLWYLALGVGILGALAFLLLGRYLNRRIARQHWAEIRTRYSRPTGDVIQQPLYEDAASGTPVLPRSQSKSD